MRRRVTTDRHSSVFIQLQCKKHLLLNTIRWQFNTIIRNASKQELCFSGNCIQQKTGTIQTDKDRDTYVGSYIDTA